MSHTLLIVEDEKHAREGLLSALEDDYDTYVAADADEAFTLMNEEEFDLILTDLRMAGKSGMSVLKYAAKMPYDPITIMMTAYGNIETAVEAIKQGAFDFLTKPVNLESLELLLKRSLQVKKNEKGTLRSDPRSSRIHASVGIIGQSSSLSKVLKEVELVAPSKATVMINGETGTGKELFAQSIHDNSPRRKKPFVAVHCAALASNLLESELFGHERGAFTGANEKRMGRFEAAEGGSLFLDEIGEIDAQTQVKLLRFLESRSFERLGSIKPIQVDVRLICATNRDLLEMVKNGTFREDLYYRLNVVRILLPSLNERKEDIPLLLEHFINFYAEENHFVPISFDREAMKILIEYRWPGNIRELRNFCENMVIMHRGKVVQSHNLDPRFLKKEEPELQPHGISVNPLSVEENEKKLLCNALYQSNGNKTKAAELLGISRRTLHRKIKQWPNLDWNRSS